jgi:predicted Zn finger-like uncharacterized protein
MMIIRCNNCNKKFEINSDLIPKDGRLLECGNCKNQWFFKNIIEKKETKTIKKPDTKKEETPVKKNKTKLEQPKNLKNLDDDKKNHSKNLKKISILSSILVFIISIMALIILVDTFKSPIGIFVPNIELILYNLYESIIDMILFFKDLL